MENLVFKKVCKDSGLVVVDYTPLLDCYAKAVVDENTAFVITNNWRKSAKMRFGLQVQGFEVGEQEVADVETEAELQELIKKAMTRAEKMSKY